MGVGGSHTVGRSMGEGFRNQGWPGDPSQEYQAGSYLVGRCHKPGQALSEAGCRSQAEGLWAMQPTCVCGLFTAPPLAMGLLTAEFRDAAAVVDVHFGEGSVWHQAWRPSAVPSGRPVCTHACALAPVASTLWRAEARLSGS